MILLLALIMLVWSIAGLCSDADHEAEQAQLHRQRERHRAELVRALKGRKKVTRTFAKDEHGRTVVQETVEYYED
jgi:hypothetical protein